MTQHDDWQQGAWGTPGAQGEPNAYQQTYNSAARGAAPDQNPAGASPRTAPPYVAPAYAVPPASGQSAPGAASSTSAPGTPAYAAPGYVAAPMPAAPKKGKGWIVALVAVILIFALMLFGMVSCNALMGTLVDPLASLEDEGGAGRVSSESVGVIELSGTIQYDGTTCSPEGLKDQLDRAEDDPNIVAVVLRVDSGGGTATAGEEMSNYIRDFSKPVVVSSASMNASAAYEISSQADYIYTAKTTAIGAIGVAMQITDLSDLLDKLGISVENITSADAKDSSYGTRPLTDEERAYYQDQVNQINETFIQTVADGRGMTTDEVRALATGLTFTGMDAVENGLADEIGTLEDAVAKAAELAGRAGCDMVYLQNTSSDLSTLLDLMSSYNGSEEDLLAALKELDNVGLKG